MKQALLLLASALFALHAQATVVSKNINYPLTGGVYQLDVNSNGTKDLFFRMKLVSGNIYCRFGVIDFAGSVDNESGTEGGSVSQGTNWQDSMNIFYAPGGYVDASSWCRIGDTCFFGFNFVDGGNHYYGWVQVKTVAGNILQIIRCAYNDVAMADLNFGDLGTTGINQTNGDESAAINLAGSEISVTAAQTVLQGARLMVRDLAGRVCAFKAISANDSHLTLRGLAAGMYVISVETQRGNVFSKKVVVE